MRKKQLFLYDADEGSSSGGDDSGSGDEGTSDDTGGSQGSAGEGQSATVPRSELSKVNAEAAKYRRERNELQERLTSLENQGKTQLEQAQEKTKTLEAAVAQADQVNRDLRVQIIAAKVGVVAEARSDAARLLDWERVSDPNSETAIEIALTDLVKEKPFLLGNVPGGADGGAGRGTGDAPLDMNALIRGSAGRA